MCPFGNLIVGKKERKKNKNYLLIPFPSRKYKNSNPYQGTKFEIGIGVLNVDNLERNLTKGRVSFTLERSFRRS